MSTSGAIFTVSVALLLGIALFFILPLYLTTEIFQIEKQALIFNLVAGLIRIIFFLLYVWGISFMKDVKRLFEYHGAEHKTINAYEAGDELTPEIVAQHSLEHPRCGTAFLLTLVLLSVLIFSLMGPMPLFWRLFTRVLFIPILAGLAYEYIRWTAKHIDSPIVRAMIKPNLSLQRLTTREPSLEIIEVGIAAFNAMRDKEQTIIL